MFKKATNVVFDLIQIDRPRPNPLSRPCFQPPLVELLVVDRHNVRNATPFFCSGDNSQSTISLGPSNVVVNQPDAVRV